jgi:catechol 2,3-dioxygenase-like lactoylglutathione lyase family enzyme
MLGTSQAFSGFSVDDAAKVRPFYEDVLGLKVTQDHGMLTLHLGSGSRVLVYPKGQAHRPATYTVLNFPVADVAQAVDGLTAKGVTMERYEGMAQDHRGIFLGGGPPIAWFQDPAGNIFSVVEES